MKHLIRKIASDEELDMDRLDFEFGELLKNLSLYHRYALAAANYLAPIIESKLSARGMSKEDADPFDNDKFNKYMDVTDEIKQEMLEQFRGAEYIKNRQHPWMKFLIFDQFLDKVGMELENDHDIPGWDDSGGLTIPSASQVFQIDDIKNLQDLKKVMPPGWENATNDDLMEPWKQLDKIRKKSNWGPEMKRLVRKSIDNNYHERLTPEEFVQKIQEIPVFYKELKEAIKHESAEYLYEELVDFYDHRNMSFDDLIQNGFRKELAEAMQKLNPIWEEFNPGPGNTKQIFDLLKKEEQLNENTDETITAADKSRVAAPPNVLQVAEKLLDGYQDTGEIVEVRHDPYVRGVYAVRTENQFVLIINVDTGEVVDEAELDEGQTLQDIDTKDPSSGLDWLF